MTDWCDDHEPYVNPEQESVVRNFMSLGWFLFLRVQLATRWLQNYLTPPTPNIRMQLKSKIIHMNILSLKEK